MSTETTTDGGLVTTIGEFAQHVGRTLGPTDKGGIQVKASFAVEVKGAPKPALVADCLFRYFA